MQLGNVINGRGPIVDEDDDEDDLPINQTMNGRLSMINPMMGMGGPLPMPVGFSAPPSGSPGWNNMNGWPQQQQNPTAMLSPAQFMLPQPTDPNFFMAHQQAMMMAKQAYQMAVAQQAMAAAGEEWERGSNVGGFGGGSVYGGVTSPTGFGQPFGMGVGMQSTGGSWSAGSMMFPPGPRSMYGGGAQSEYGGGSGAGGGGGGWSSSRSVYGESFGPPGDRYNNGNSGRGTLRPPGFGQRESGYLAPPVPPVPPQGSHSSGARGTPRSRTASQPASPTRPGVRKGTPPSSWKAGV